MDETLLLELSSWRERCEALADAAEALQAPEPGADHGEYFDSWFELCNRWISLLWSGIKPALIAESCRWAAKQQQAPALELHAGAEVAPGFELIESKRLDALLLLAAQQEQKERLKAERLAEGKRASGRPRVIDETEDEAAVADRRIAYAAKVAAEREAAEQAEAEQRARILEIAAAAPVPTPEPTASKALFAVGNEPTPEPAPEPTPEPAAAAAARPLAQHGTNQHSEPEGEVITTSSPQQLGNSQAYLLRRLDEEEAQEPADDGRQWVSAVELAELLGTNKNTIDHWRRGGVLDDCWRLPAPDRVRGLLYDVEACRAAIEAHRAKPPKPPTRTPEEQRERRRIYQAQRRARLREQQAAPAEPLPVVIEPEVAQVPAVEPGAGAADARALLELAGADPAVLKALRVLLLQPQSEP